ncbi:hypothetical protein C8Q79DRAFT_927848 [Trametes meyenii]|nr:hypothetical protein C8Q79DRAFT_927848 [Trametes meyenii]
MFNRTADYFAHGSRSLSPALQRLDPEQRLRLAKSSQKIGKLLGEMPVVDVVPSTPANANAVFMDQAHGTNSPLERKKAVKSKRKAPPVPVLRYKLPSTRPVSIVTEGSGKPTPRPRKAIPNSLDLVSSAMRVENTVSRYGYLETPITPDYLSPLTPISPLSPIVSSELHKRKLQSLRRLARTSRAFRGNATAEVAPPSLGQASEDMGNVKTYPDLYRMSTRQPRRSALVSGRRRSCSVGEPQRQSIADVLSVSSPDARTSYIVPLSASLAPYVVALGSPALSPAITSPPAMDDSPLQQQQSVAQAKAAILGTDAQRMESFRRGFRIHALPATPSTPLRAFASIKSPKAPYWVRSAYRPRDSTHGSIRRSQSRRGASRPPPTPRTMRRERRQGWGGEWKRGKMGAAVEKLKEVETKVAEPVVESALRQSGDKYSLHLVHRDISAGNILIRTGASRKTCTESEEVTITEGHIPSEGFLSDWRPLHRERTFRILLKVRDRLRELGTAIYLLLRHLSTQVQAGRDLVSVRCEAHHDVKSLGWIIIYAVYRHTLDSGKLDSAGFEALRDEFQRLYTGDSFQSLWARREVAIMRQDAGNMTRVNQLTYFKAGCRPLSLFLTLVWTLIKQCPGREDASDVPLQGDLWQEEIISIRKKWRAEKGIEEMFHKGERMTREQLLDAIDILLSALEHDEL